MIKPEFFRSRSLAKVSRDARLTFIGLWTEADATGRGVANPRILLGSIWPLEDDFTAATIVQHLRELSDTGHIRLYGDDGDEFYVIESWEKHQSAAYRTGTAQHPEPPSHASCTTSRAQVVPIVKEKGREVSPLPSAGEFDEFWSQYPRKVSKKDAVKAYAKARREATAEQILQALGPVQAMHRDPSRRQFIPYPASWLNDGRWLDEEQPAPTTPARPFWAVEV